METLEQNAEIAEYPRAPVFRPTVTVALVLFTVRREQLHCLLEPLPGGTWRLPGCVPGARESLESAACGALGRLTGAPPDVELEQLHTWTRAVPGEPQPALEVAYLALTCLTESRPSGAARSAWWPFGGLPPLVAAHAEIIEYASRRLRRLLSDMAVARPLLPQQFTLGDLQLVYEAVQGRALDKRNFRKWALGSGLVEATPNERRYGPHRPARLYCFAERPGESQP